MLYTMKAVAAVAKTNHFAVPAFNICSFDMLKAIMEEVEDQQSPVILEIHPDEIEYLGDKFVATVRAYACDSDVPVVIHLDHGGTLYDVMRAIKNGYTSVMIDASALSFAENEACTKQVADIAHLVGVSVEGELGTIGNNNAGAGGANAIIYTDPNRAREFVEATGIDMLAVAIGTAHGLYPKGITPRLNIDLLCELEAKIDIPFVLHGGSGNPDDEVHEATKHGVCKVNLSSDLKSAFFRSVREQLHAHPDRYEPNQIYPEANSEVKKVVNHKLHVLGAIGMASKY